MDYEHIYTETDGDLYEKKTTDQTVEHVLRLSTRCLIFSLLTIQKETSWFKIIGF